MKATAISPISTSSLIKLPPGQTIEIFISTMAQLLMVCEAEQAKSQTHALTILPHYFESIDSDVRRHERHPYRNGSE